MDFLMGRVPFMGTMNYLLQRQKSSTSRILAMTRDQMKRSFGIPLQDWLRSQAFGHRAWEKRLGGLGNRKALNWPARSASRLCGRACAAASSTSAAANACFETKKVCSRRFGPVFTIRMLFQPKVVRRC